MDKVRTKRYWYFVTQDFMGRKMQLHPRLPHCAGANEPNVKRICVAPTAAHCMSAIMFMGSSPIYVYRTHRRVTATKAWDVDDSQLTHEHFLLRSSWFELVASISPKWVERLENRCAFENRGEQKDTSGWKFQKLQRRQLIRAVSKLDKRLAVIKLSDTDFRYEGEQMLLGGKWPDIDHVSNREDELMLLGLKPMEDPKPIHTIKSDPIKPKPTSHVVDLDISSMYLHQPIKCVTFNHVIHSTDDEAMHKYLTDFV